MCSHKMENENAGTQLFNLLKCLNQKQQSTTDRNLNSKLFLQLSREQSSTITDQTAIQNKKSV